METMNNIFHPYLDNFVVVFIDDILIFFKTEEDHTRHLRIVHGTLRQHKFCAKLKKYEFWLSEVGFLSHESTNMAYLLTQAKSSPSLIG
jgi:hypothetical protein